MQDQKGMSVLKKTIYAVPKKTEVGFIPKDWDFVLLGDLSEFVTSGSRGWAQFYSEDGALFIRSQNVRDGKLSFDDVQYVSPPVGTEGNRTKVKLNDLLITITGNSVGNVALADQAFDEAYISQHVGLVRLKEPTRGAYICRYLSPSSPGNSQIVGSQSGQSKPGLNLQNLKDFCIALPKSPTELQAITSALSDVDVFLATLKRIITKKQAIKTAIMQQLLTGRTRLPKFSRHSDGTLKGYKSSELGELPEDWNVLTYGEVFDFLSTSTNSRSDLSHKGEYGYIHYGDIHTKWNNKLDAHFTELPKISKKLASSSFLENGDIIMADASEDYSGIGKSVEICNIGNQKIVAGLHTYLLRDKHKQLSDGYRGYLHSNENVKKIIDKLATGMKVFGISKNNLMSVSIPVPSKQEQTAITTILSDMDAELAALEQKLAKARDIKQGMMQQLLTGRIRLALDHQS